jgi:hypothetical protein
MVLIMASSGRRREPVLDAVQACAASIAGGVAVS